ncbi:hypothetical protein MMC19_000842 [Ptychographa xylographoides]|nr:hypothetical protein [Ptychographa xylographoides]
MYSLAPQDTGDNVVLYFDSSARSRKLSKIGLGVSWCAGIVCLGVGVRFVTDRSGAYLNLNIYTKEILPLVLNVLVTGINEALGYIHTNSLRWALQREGRLAFNSNLRLFTSARSSRPNAWYTNTCMLWCIIMSYASTSLIFMGDIPHSQAPGIFSSLLPANYTNFVCGYALLTLAAGILGQCLIASVALYSAGSSPTWSSSPIDTAAACVAVAAIGPVPGRCLRSVHDKEHDALPVGPLARQRSAYTAHKEVRVVFLCLWLTVTFAVLWGGVLIGVVDKLSDVDGMYPGVSWAFLPNLPATVDLRAASWDGNTDMSGTMTLAIPWDVVGQFTWQDTPDPYIPFASFCWAFALVCLLQTIMTVSLHCAELLVNIIRDEKTWRRASSPSSKRSAAGLSRSPVNALHALCVSGPALTLFLYKPVLHSLFGLAVSAYFSVGLVMRPPQIFYLSVGALLLASFVSAFAFWPPKGPQPASFGHLQTLVDLIDEWPEQGERMFWGRKTGGKVVDRWGEEQVLRAGSATASREVLELESLESRAVAHAGTSAVKLDDVRFDELYMGDEMR